MRAGNNHTRLNASELRRKPLGSLNNSAKHSRTTTDEGQLTALSEVGEATDIAIAQTVGLNICQHH